MDNFVALTRNDINLFCDASLKVAEADISIALSDDEIIIDEAKTCKGGGFAKYSTTSRQVKAYVNRAKTPGKRVAMILIIAPSFSDKFIESVDT